MRHTRALTLLVGSIVVGGPTAVAATTTPSPPSTAPATSAATTAPAVTTAAAPTAPPTSGPAATTAAGATTAPAPAPSLAGGAAVQDFQAAAEAIIGPTDDAFGRLAGLAPFSVAMPTPAGSFLESFDIQYFDDDYVASIELQLAVPAADAVATWQAAATAAGLQLDSDTTASNGEISERDLTFRSPADDSDVYLSLTVTDRPDVDTARIHFEDAIALEASEFTRTWATVVSVPTGGEFSYGTFRYDTEWGSGSIGVSYDFPGGDAAAMREQMVATMPANGFTFDSAENTDPQYVYLDADPAAGGYTDADLSFRQVDDLAMVSATATFSADTPPIPEPAAPDPSATTAAPATTAPAGPTTPVSTAAPIFAPAVPAGATMAQIGELIRGIFGPTTDAPAELSPFIPVLSGIPTPPDAVVEAFDMDTLDLSAGTVATGRILFTTATPPAESLALYANAAAALGMVETANATTTEDGEVTTAVAYEVPDAERSTGFDVHVVDGETDYVQLTINTPTDAPVGVEINAAVVAAVGLPAGGEVSPALSISLGWFSDDVNFMIRVGYPGDEATVKASVDAAVLAAGATLDADGSSDSYQYYDTADGGSVQVSYYEGSDGSTDVSIIYSLPLG